MPDEKITVLQRLAEDGSSTWGYLWLVVLAAWGGSVSYLSRLKEDSTKRFSTVELTGEWTISAFSGLLTAFLCAEMGVSYYLTAVACAISGHMGGRAISLIEGAFKARAGYVPPPPQNKKDGDSN